MGRCGWMGAVAALVVLGAGGAKGESAPGAAALPAQMAARGGRVVVKVTDYDPARQSVLDAALRQGAELLGSRTVADFQGKKQGWLRFRLPADRLPGLLAALHGTGKLYAEAATARDHRSEYEELAGRIGRLREHQQRLADLLQSSRRMRGSDILYLQERLFRAGVDEGALRQRRVDLERAARTGSLVVELFEPEPRRAMDLGNWYAGASLRAHTALYRALARALTAGAYALAFAPFWIPGLAAALLLGCWLWRRARLLAARTAAILALLARVAAERWPARPVRS